MWGTVVENKVVLNKMKWYSIWRKSISVFLLSWNLGYEFNSDTLCQEMAVDKEKDVSIEID